MEFSVWITKKYTEWRGDSIGNDHSITRFAKLLGVPQQTMNAWMRPGSNGPIKKKYIDALIAHYGDEVYNVIPDLNRDGNIPKYGPETARILHKFAELKPEYRTDVEDFIDDKLKRQKQPTDGGFKIRTGKTPVLNG